MTQFNIKTYRSLSLNEQHRFFNFCKAAAKETNKPASKNMWSDDWKNDPASLLYILENGNRFNGVKGEFFLLFDGDNIVGCSGIYISDFNDSIAIAGVRTWIDFSYRNLTLNKEYLLPIQKKWAIENGLKLIALTFNRYNKSIIDIFKRIRLGERSDRISSRSPCHLFFNGIVEVPFSVNIQYTEQWVIYEHLDNEFNYDWQLIRFDNL